MADLSQIPTDQLLAALNGGAAQPAASGGYPAGDSRNGPAAVTIAPPQQPAANAPQQRQQDPTTSMMQDAGQMLMDTLHGTGALYTAAHSAADTATFGLADKASAGIAHMLAPTMTGQPLSYEDAYNKIKSNNAQNAGQNPVSALAGDIGGAVVGGSALARGLGAAARAIPGGADALELLTPAAKQPIANVAKAAVTGAGAAGGYTATDDLVRNGTIDPGNVALNAVTGAVVGPAVSKIGTMIAKGVQNNSTKAMGVLADKLGETPATLQRVYDNFSAATGRVPTMAELVGMQSQGELKALAAKNPIIQQGINTAADTAAAQRPDTLSSIIDDSAAPVTAGSLPEHLAQAGTPETQNALAQGRTARMTTAMDPIRNSAVGIDTTDVGLLADPRVRAAVRADPDLSARIRETVDDINENGQSDNLSVNDIDSIRRSLRAQQTSRSNPGGGVNYNPHIAGQYGELADNIAALGTSAEPGYQDALDQFGRDSNYIKGFAHGNAGKSIGEASNPDLISALNEAEGQAGHQAGIVSRTAAAAVESPDAAVRTAATLANGSGDSAVLRQATGQAAFTPVQAAAQAETQGATALNNISGRIAPQAEGISGREVAQTIAAGASHSPAGMMFHVARAIPSFSKLSDGIQRQVVRYLADPAMTQQGINLLRRAGAQDDQIRRLAVALSANAGLNTANTLGQ